MFPTDVKTCKVGGILHLALQSRKNAPSDGVVSAVIFSAHAAFESSFFESLLVVDGGVGAASIRMMKQARAGRLLARALSSAARARCRSTLGLVAQPTTRLEKRFEDDRKIKPALPGP